MKSDFLYRKNGYHYLLLPFSWLYQLIIYLRKKFYNWGFLRTHYFPVPIIVVGNITVGGTGKTPITIEIAQWLKTMNLRPGIVTRGYGGKSKQWPQIINKNSDPFLVSEEALLLYNKSGCPVVAAPNRSAAVKMLLANHSCEVIISDDGLQHYALARDLEVLLADEQRTARNHFCLPAGPFRESKKKINQVDIVLKKNHDYHWELVEIHQVINPDNKISLAELKNKKIHAIAGIGNPDQFFQQLQSYGFDIISHVFPDHFHYQKKDIHFSDDYPVLMTEKDAIKCKTFAGQRHWYVSIQASINAEAKNKFLTLFTQIRREKNAKQLSIVAGV